MEVIAVHPKAVNFDRSRESGKDAKYVIAVGVHRMGRGERVVMDHADVQDEHGAHHTRWMDTLAQVVDP